MKPWAAVRLKTKALPKLPKIKPLKCEYYKESKHSIEDTLATLKSIGDFKLKEYSDVSSELSDISDVFEEFHLNSFLRPQEHKRYIKKYEADLRTVDGFTSGFKNVMKNIRKHTIGENTNLTLESTEDIVKLLTQSPKKNGNKPTTGGPKKIDLDKILDSVPPIRRIPITPKDLQQRHYARKEEDESSTTSSAIWHWLAVNFDDTKFYTTPPTFNAFRQNEPHWSERAPIAWEVVDECNIKCADWLRTCETF